MMIHLENTFVADRTVMCSGWLWLDAFLADAHSLRDKASLGWITCWYSYAHIIMKADVNQQPVSD